MVQQKKNATIRYFGDYVLMGEIAEGGMGVVFDARQISLNRRVALKLIRSGARASASGSRNAIRLLEKIGFPATVVDEARRLASQSDG